MYHVPLVPRDADREETMFRIEQSLHKVMEISQEIFQKVEGKLGKVVERAERLDKRTAIVERKIEKLKETDNMITFNIPRQLPKITDRESTSLFRINVDSEFVATSDNLPEYKRHDDHLLRPCEPIDFTRELNKTDKFFLTSAAMREYEQKHKEKQKKKMLTGLRQLPRNLEDFDIAELFFAGTSIPVYQGVSGDFPRQHLDAEGSSTRKSMRNGVENEEERLHEQLLEDTALSNGLLRDSFGTLDDDHPLAFRMEKEKERTIELPESLPNLKGYARDLRLSDLGIDEDLLPDIPDDVAPLEVVPEETDTSDLFSLPPPPPISVKVETITVTEIPPPPPPPPPPLLPPTAPPTAPPTPDVAGSSVTFSPTKSVENGRSDLMAAIRAAGGASNAKLNKVQESQRLQKRKGKYDGLLETSALSSEPASAPSAGGDLMSALSKALDARRKAISGKVPAPPAPHRLSDEEWD